MPQIGDIVQEAKYRFTDPHGRVWFQGNNVKGYIPPARFAGGELEPGQEIGPLVNIGPEQYAPDRYEKEICKKFFFRNNGFHRSAAFPEAWVPRWAEAAETPERVTLESPTGEMEFPKSHKHRVWRLARTERWVMPAYAARYAAESGPSLEFCPESLLNVDYAPAYEKSLFADEAEYAPPIAYRAELTGGLIQGRKPLRIYLHGALSPLKWHTKIRKHLFSAMASADRRERELWERWLGISFPDPRETAKLYENCHEEDHVDLCRRCAPDHFREIHQRILEMNYDYWKAAVTFWESEATKKVEIRKIPIGFGKKKKHIFDIQCFTTGPVGISLKSKTVRRYPYLVFRGNAYRFDDSGREAVFHLSFLTFFFRNYFKKNKGFMEIQNVSRI